MATGTTTQPTKAVAAFVLSFLTALYASVQGRDDLGDLGTLEWLIVVLGAAVTAGAVFGLTNKPTNTT